MAARPAPKVAAVIGDPVRHSLSPTIHNAAFAAVGLDWAFTAFEVPAGSGAAALDAMRLLGLAGLSVTMPLKAEAAAAADSRDAEVDALGVANCVIRRPDGSLHAANTDVGGFIGALRADAGVDPQGLRFVLIGAGGAAKAVAWGLAAAGAADISVINRTEAKAQQVAEVANDAGLQARAPGRVGSVDDIASADVVVNATSLGMRTGSAMPCDPALLRDGQIAVDLIYEPLETSWLGALRAGGIEAHNGLSMLVHQAALAFERWTGQPAPLDVMRQAVEQHRT